jgi:hypothetical protein
MKSDLSTTISPPSDYTNRNYVSPILRRVLSKTALFAQNHIMLPKYEEVRRSESRIGTEMSNRSGSSASNQKSNEDLMIDVTTEENVQFMDQPLRGKIELNGLLAPIDSVSIALRGVVKTCVAGTAAWTNGFGDSNVMARFTEREVRTQFRSFFLTSDFETRVCFTSLYTTCYPIVSYSTTYTSICIFVSWNGEFAT